jgi:hypothetical protein
LTLLVCGRMLELGVYKLDYGLQTLNRTLIMSNLK